MKAKYIKRREQFEREARELLKSLGAVEQKSSNPWPQYTLNTPAGELRLAALLGTFSLSHVLNPSQASVLQAGSFWSRFRKMTSGRT